MVSPDIVAPVHTGPGLPAGRAVVWDDRVRLVSDASVVLGGAPWRVLRIAPAGRAFVRRLRAAGPAGLVPSPGVEKTLADLLLTRGVVHPLATTVGTGTGTAPATDIVVPAYQRPEMLDSCLASLRRTAPDSRIIVVDDASPSPRVGEVARAHGATVLRHEMNRGPAAARNTGLSEADSPQVAFVDADCVATEGWLDILIPHFDDPRVVAVAPRITARVGRPTVLARYESARSALDMGARPQLVSHGAPLGYLPSAALVVRRSALEAADAFDEDLRVGEDVDLVWRLVDSGAMVRYEPASIVSHEMRPEPLRWAGRIVDYGTSAADLDHRHPGRLTPARLSLWNAAAALLLFLPWRTAGRLGAAGFIAASTLRLSRTLRGSSIDPKVAVVITGKRLASDAAATGHLLRREWWPVGWLAIACARRSRTARAATAVMLAPPVWEWLTGRPPLDLPRYLALRLVEDAAYGSGVIAGAARRRRPGVLLPRLQRPRGG